MPVDAPTPPTRGLGSAEAEARLARFGPNDPAPQEGHPLLVEIGLLFANPLVLILLVAAGASAFVGERVDAVIIVAIVLVSAVIDFVQTYRSHRTTELLRATVAPTATVLRDGAFREIPRVEVVPGDVVRLSAGDLVPADAVLIEARDLHVQEASLTGESMPVEKRAAPAEGPRATPDPETMAYLGTSVMSGTAIAEVVATGKATSFGGIAARLSARAPQTAFDRGVRRFGFLITQVVVFLVLFVVVVSVALRRPALESLLFAVALAVGLTPELMPMITSVTLAKGAVRMAREKVVVKHLSAIQNLGGVDVLCSDKTGTLTAGEMVLDRSLDAAGKPAPRVLALAALNSRFETGVKSPLDTAILARATDDDGWRKDDEIPFDFERRCLSIAVTRAGEHLLVTKGAPEAVLARAASYEVDGAPVPLGAEARARCVETDRALGAEGLRTLAVAWRRLPEPGPCSAADERDLTLAGFLAFSDPPLADAALALQDLARDGVPVKILTGDGELVDPARLRGGGPARRSRGARRGGRAHDGHRARSRGRGEGRLRPALARAEEPDHRRAPAPEPRRRLPRRRHQRRAVAARRRCRDFGLDRGGRGPRRGRHHPARARASASCTAGLSKGGGRSAT